MRGKFLVTPAIAAAIAGATPALAAEHVVNGGFETGDFTGWTLTGNTAFTDVSGDLVHSGSFAGDFGQVDATGSLTQSLSTVAGQVYSVSFWLANDGGTTTSFVAAFGGDTLLTLSDPPGSDYTLYTYNVTASSSSTLLDFTFRQDPAFFHIDDVSVQDVGSVPEPATWAMMILGMGAAGFALRRRKTEATVHLA